ncbi:uncharacterized protein LOC144115387 [Amblyomma americanum]
MQTRDAMFSRISIIRPADDSWLSSERCESGPSNDVLSKIRFARQDDGRTSSERCESPAASGGTPSVRSPQADDQNATESTPSCTASSMEEEIQNLSSVKDLEERHIRHLFNKVSPVLDQIGRREVYSWRLETYIKGGRDKIALTHRVPIHKFSTKVTDQILYLFAYEFGKRRGFDGDIINQVFIPEFLVRIFMECQGTTFEESERLMWQ